MSQTPSSGSPVLARPDARPTRQWVELFVMLARRDITIRYKQSIMGFLWAVLMPTLTAVAGVLVRTLVARLAGAGGLDRGVVAEIVVKSVPWAFVVAGIRLSTTSLVANANLVTKIYMPREVFPVAAIGSQLFDMGIAAVPLAVAVGVLGAPATIHLLWVPILLAILVALVLGCGLVLSALGLFFRDVKYLVEVALMFGVFVTPVFFSASLLGDWRTAIMLNPVAPVLEGLAAAIVRGQSPDVGWTCYSATIAAGGLLAGYRLFKHLEPTFAESI